MTTPTTPPVDLQAIEARSIEEQRLKARVGVWVSHPSFYPLSKRTVGQLQEDAAALLSLIREKDQVIERLEGELADFQDALTPDGKELHRQLAQSKSELDAVVLELDLQRDQTRAAWDQIATLKAGQEARELALLQYALPWCHIRTVLNQFNATYSGEKMK